MSETLDSMIKTAKDAHKLNKEIAKEAQALAASFPSIRERTIS